MFHKGKERRHERRAERKEKRAERKEEGHGKKIAAGAAIGAAVGLGVNAIRKKKEKNSGGVGYESDSESSVSSASTVEGLNIMHPSEFSVEDVQYFLMAIGLEKHVEVFNEKQINGKVMISITKVELEKQCGFTSAEIKRFYASIEFAYQICEGSKEPEKPTCKPPKQWSEVELCIVLVIVGMGEKVEEVKQKHVNGAMVVKMTKVQIEQECGMTTVEVQRLDVVIKKTMTSGGCGMEPEVDIMPITDSNVEPIVDAMPITEGNMEPTVDTMPITEVEPDKGPSKGAIGIAVGGAIIAGGIGYAAWKKHQSNKDEEEQEISQEEQEISQDKEEEISGGGDCSDEVEPPPCKHPESWTKIEVQYFLIAIGLESKCDAFEENNVDGKLLVTLTTTELANLGCSTVGIFKIQISIEFCIEIADGCQETKPPCKPPQNWNEQELCLVLVMVGLGAKVEEFKKHRISGTVAVSMTKVELEQECGMTSIEVHTFKAVVVKR